MREIESIEEVDLPDGSYKGVMGGDQVSVYKSNKLIRFKTNIRIRSTNAVCLIGIKDKKAKILI